MFQVEKIDIKALHTRYLKAAATQDKEAASVMAMELMQDLIDTIKTIPAILENWANQVDELGLTYDNIPPIVIDYIDEEIGNGRIKPESMEKDIIRLFEKGCFKGLITDDGEIDPKVLAVFTQKRQRDLNKQKARVARIQKTSSRPQAEDDVF